MTLDAEGVNRAWKKAGGQGNAPELSANSPGIVLARGQKGEKSKPRLWTPPDPEKDLVEVKVKGRGLVQVPRGIDPGWDYVPGSEAFEAQKREELKRRAEAEQKRRGLLAELDAALDSALAELKAIEADARAEVQKLGAPESVAREAFAQLEALVAEAIADARKAHANAKKGAEKIEFNEADERKAELVAVLRQIVERARRAAIDETRDTIADAAMVREAIEAGPEIRLAPTASDSRPTVADDLDEPTPPPKVPSKPVKDIAARHLWNRLSRKIVRPENSVILPGTPWQEDLKEIREGLAISTRDRSGAQIFVINGRVYGVHDSKDGGAWIPFPIQGDGIAPSTRRSYKALRIIQDYQTIAGAQSRLYLEKFSRHDALAAWLIWDAIRRGKKR